MHRDTPKEACSGADSTQQLRFPDLQKPPQKDGACLNPPLAAAFQDPGPFEDPSSVPPARSGSQKTSTGAEEVHLVEAVCRS